MKIYLAIFLYFSATTINAQRIKINEVDKFTKLKVIETTPIQIKNAILGGISFALGKYGDQFRLISTGFGSYSVDVFPDQELVILLENDSIVTVYASREIQTTKESAANVYGGYYVQGQKYFKHLYVITKKQIELLHDFKVNSIRRFHSNGNADIDIKSGNRDDLMKLTSVFLKEINK